MKLTLIRHTSVACGTGICYGQTDVDVAGTFEHEAAEVHRQLSDRTFDKTFSSPLQRCTKLAYFCGYAQPALDNRLLELHFGDWEGIPWDKISEDPNSADWFRDWINVRATNGESFFQQVQRVKDFIEELKLQSYDNVLIFTHAGVVRAVAVLLGLVEIELAFSDYRVEYGEIKCFDL